MPKRQDADHRSHGYERMPALIHPAGSASQAQRGDTRRWWSGADPGLPSSP